MTNPVDSQRLQIVLEAAGKDAREARAQIQEKQADLAKERTQYFEKIALGSAGTIAAMVSFVGAHSGRLRPPWLLRSALVTLVIAMVAAMIRNLIYPRYVEAVYFVADHEAQLRSEQARADFFASVPARDIHTGGPVDARGFLANHMKVVPAFTELISQTKEKETRYFRCSRLLEQVSLSAVGVGITLLVALAWFNF